MLIGDVCGIRRWLARAYYQSLLEACWNERPTSGSIGRVVICEKGTTVKANDREATEDLHCAPDVLPQPDFVIFTKGNVSAQLIQRRPALVWQYAAR